MATSSRNGILECGNTAAPSQQSSKQYRDLAQTWNSPQHRKGHSQHRNIGGTAASTPRDWLSFRARHGTHALAGKAGTVLWWGSVAVRLPSCAGLRSWVDGWCFSSLRTRAKLD